MSIPDTDFIGFSFNGIHSSELGIVRTSDGSRFNENLLPNFQDKAIPVPGGDGAYYFGSYYSQRQFPVSFAFDSLTEKEINKIKVLLGDRKIHDLFFDENPYKIYKAKVSNSSMIKFIAFAEGATNRKYKGEGSITFTCFQPFARAPHKYLKDYNDYNKFVELRITEKDYKSETFFLYDESTKSYYLDDKGKYSNHLNYFIRKTSEWSEASRMKESKGDYDKKVLGMEEITISLYNPGNLESDWILTLNFDDQGKIPECKFSIDSEHFLSLTEISQQNDDVTIKINTKTGLIEGYHYSPTGDLIRSGNIYNQYMNTGTFFKIPKTFEINSDKEKTITFTFSNQEIFNNLDKYPLDYTYYYF